MVDKRNECPDSCPRKSECLNNPCIKGSGNRSSKIILVGENPDRAEDEDGFSLSGEAGRLLNTVFAQLNIKREDLFITDAVKCGTNKEDPKPSAKEIKFCRHFLEEEIKEIQPTVIGVLGATALKSVLNRTGISKLKNNVFFSEEFNCKVVPIYHPRYILRNPNEFYSLSDGIKLIIEESKTQEVNKSALEGCRHLVADTPEKIDEVLSILEKKDKFVFDLETQDLNYLRTEILCVAVSWKEKLGVVIPWKSMSKLQLERFVSILQTKKLKINHNIKFDIQVLKANKICVKGPFFDTMLAHHLIDENTKHGLDDLTLRYLDLGEYWAELEKEKDRICKEKKIPKEDFTYDMLPTKVLYPYAAKDADVTYRLYNILSKELNRQNLTKFFNDHTMAFMPILLYMEFKGIKIDREKLAGLITECKKQIVDVESALLEYEDVKKYENNRKLIAIKKLEEKYNDSKILKSRYPNGVEEYAHKSLKEDDWKFNFHSPKQLQELLFKQMGLKASKETKTGFSTDEESMIELAETQGIDFAKKLVEYRKLTKYCSTYLEAVYRKSEYDGRIHTTYQQHLTVSGRLSSRNPNLQNVKRDAKDFKSCFISDPGFIFVKSDLSQAEFRCWAHYSGDTDMIRDIEAGLDIHRLIASEVFNVPIEQIDKKDPRRTAAKNCVIGETWISTNTGFRYIRDLKEGDIVLDHLNKEQTILETIKKEDDVYVVDTECGSVTCTKDHPFYVINENCEIVTKPLSLLNVNDYILSCTPKNTQQEYVKWAYAGQRVTSFKSIFDTWILNEDMAFLVGFIVAEGSVDARTSYMNVRWSQKGEFVNQIDLLSNRLFKERVVKSIDNRTNVFTWRVTSLEFVEFLKYIGMCTNNKKGFKRFPHKIMESPPSVQKAFLQGYFLGDGTFKNKLACVGTVSKDLCDNVCLLFRSFGIYPKIHVEHPKNGHDFYNIHITNKEELDILVNALEIKKNENWVGPTDNNGRKFLHNVNSYYFKHHVDCDVRYAIKLRKQITHLFLNRFCRGLNKNIDTLLDNKIYSVKIKSITPIGRSDVYDFVTTGDKVMVANGFYTLDCVFGLMYGRGTAAISLQYGITVEQAEQIKESFFSRYPTASRWLNNIVSVARETGCVKTWFGRVRRLPKIHSDNLGDRAEAERQAKNSPIQGQASDMNNAYLRNILREARAKGIECYPAATIHDDNTLQVREEQADQLIAVMKHVVATTFPDFKCKMELEFKKGNNLGYMEDVK